MSSQRLEDRSMAPIARKPSSISAQVEGSGTLPATEASKLIGLIGPVKMNSPPLVR